MHYALTRLSRRRQERVNKRHRHRGLQAAKGLHGWPLGRLHPAPVQVRVRPAKPPHGVAPLLVPRNLETSQNLRYIPNHIARSLLLPQLVCWGEGVDTSSL